MGERESLRTRCLFAENNDGKGGRENTKPPRVEARQSIVLEYNYTETFERASKYLGQSIPIAGL